MRDFPDVFSHSSAGPSPRRTPRARLLVVVALTLTLPLAQCGPRHAGVAETPVAPLSSSSTPGTTPDRHLAVHALPDGSLQFELAFTPRPGPLRIQVPASWGGREGFDQPIVDIHLHSGETSLALQPLRRSADLLGPTFDAAPPALRLRWRLVPLSGPLDATQRFLPVTVEDATWAPGHSLLLQPDPEVLSEGLRLELGSGLRFTLPTDAPLAPLDLREGALLAGRWRETPSTSADVVVLVPEGAGRAAVPVADAARRVAAALDPLLGAHRPTVIHVVVLPHVDPGHLGGYGRAGGVVLELGRDRASTDTDLLALLAHEWLHLRIGHSLRFAARDEDRTLWFREGVTDYLALQAIARARLIPEERFFARLAEAVTNWRANPARSADAADADRRRLPYDHGFLLAAAIDLELRRTHGRALVDWLDALDAPPGGLVTEERLADTLAALAPGGPLADWVRGDIDAPIFAQIERAGLRLVEGLEPFPWYGARVGTDRAGVSRVLAVDPGSPAASAGLRSGELVLEGQRPPGDATPWRLRVQGEGQAPRTVTLVASRGMTNRFRLEARDPADDGWRAAFGLGR